MLITDEKFFCEELDTSVNGLKEIDKVFREKGLEAAEKQLADHIRSILRPSEYLRIPRYDWDSDWVFRGKDMYEAAESILNGEMCSAGGVYTFPDAKIIWEHNPTYNEYKEWTWQLSRHHQWRCLGWCYQQTGDEKYTECFVDHLMSWCEQAHCPEKASPYDTKCWRTIEAGIRMRKNWPYAIHSFIKSPLLTDHVITTFMKSIWEHGYRLSTSYSSGNWLIMELVGIAHIVMLYPIFRKNDEWKQLSFGMLEKELDIQIHPDGFQYELSTNYHDVIIHNYDMLLFTAKVMGYDIPGDLTTKLEALFELDIKVVCPDGRYPDLNDGGRGLLSERCQMGMRYFSDNPRISYFATNGKEGRLPDYTSVALPYAGHAYMRTGWGKKDLWLFMDAGPFGKSHQHEDKLNVLMFAYGKNVLPDTGNYAYDTSQMRHFVLSSYSHNVGLIDGLGQNRRSGYRWSPEMINQLSDMKWSFSGEIDAVEGVYNEGYGEKKIPITHSRKTVFFKQGLGGSLPFAAVIDRYVSEDGDTHEFATSYQMDTQPYTVNGKCFTADHGDGVTMNIIGSVEPRLLVAQKQPYFIGWRKRSGADSDDFEHYHAPCVQYVMNGKAKRMVTLLYPSNNGEVVISEVVASDNVADTEIRFIICGKEVTIDENDYPCLAQSDEFLRI